MSINSDKYLKIIRCVIISTALSTETSPILIDISQMRIVMQLESCMDLDCATMLYY